MGDLDARVQIFGATALGRGRMANLTLDRLYLGKTPNSSYRRLSGLQVKSGHKGVR